MREGRSDAGQDDGDMHDVSYLRARARHLRAEADTSRDPEIARALRQVAGDFDNEATNEESEHTAGAETAKEARDSPQTR